MHFINSQAQTVILPRRIPIAAGASPQTWNPADKDAGLNLTNSNLTFEETADVGSSARSLRTVASSQKVYYETTIDVLNFRLAVGFANANFNLSGTIPGEDNFFSDAFSLDANGNFHMAAGNGTPNPFSSGFSVSDSIETAWDSGANLYWARISGGAWNPALAGTQDPATGQGGKATNMINAGPYFAVCYARRGQGSSRFASGSWLHTAPSGFTAIT